MIEVTKQIIGVKISKKNISVPVSLMKAGNTQKAKVIVPVFPFRWGAPLLFQKFAQPFLRGQFPRQLTVR